MGNWWTKMAGTEPSPIIKTDLFVTMERETETMRIDLGSQTIVKIPNYTPANTSSPLLACAIKIFVGTSGGVQGQSESLPPVSIGLRCDRAQLKEFLGGFQCPLIFFLCFFFPRFFTERINQRAKVSELGRKKTPRRRRWRFCMRFKKIQRIFQP